MIIDPKARIVIFKNRPPAPFKLISTKKFTPPDCSCGQPADRMALISTPIVTTGSVWLPICSICLCIYQNGGDGS